MAVETAQRVDDLLEVVLSSPNWQGRASFATPNERSPRLSWPLEWLLYAVVAIAVAAWSVLVALGLYGVVT
jgi:hypothetical protein